MGGFLRVYLIVITITIVTVIMVIMIMTIMIIITTAITIKGPDNPTCYQLL